MPKRFIPSLKNYIEHSWLLYVIKLKLERLSIDRNQFIADLPVSQTGILLENA